MRILLGNLAGAQEFVRAGAGASPILAPKLGIGGKGEADDLQTR